MGGRLSGVVASSVSVFVRDLGEPNCSLGLHIYKETTASTKVSGETCSLGTAPTRPRRPMAKSDFNIVHSVLLHSVVLRGIPLHSIPVIHVSPRIGLSVSLEIDPFDDFFHRFA